MIASMLEATSAGTAPTNTMTKVEYLGGKQTFLLLVYPLTQERQLVGDSPQVAQGYSQAVQRPSLSYCPSFTTRDQPGWQPWQMLSDTHLVQLEWHLAHTLFLLM